MLTKVSMTKERQQLLDCSREILRVKQTKNTQMHIQANPSKLQQELFQ